MKHAFRASLLSASIGAIFAAAPVVAQTNAKNDDGAALETVVVTSQKRTEKLQEVPVSVTALSPAALDNLNVTNVNTLQNAVPNILMVNVGSPNAVTAYIRSIGTANAVFSQDPAIGVYVDDVYLTRSLGANRAFFDIEQVEVLRGPQGTLYGSNSPAGAIRVVTAKPDVNAGVEGKVELGLGNYGAVDVNAAVNVPISAGKTAARIVVMSSKHDGYQKNLVDGSEGSSNDSLGARIHLFSKLNADWNVLLSADSTTSRAKGTVAVSYYDPVSKGAVDLFKTPGFNKRDFYSEKKADDRYDNMDTHGVSVDVHGKIAGANFRSISAYRYLNESINNDVDARAFDAFTAHQILDNRQFTQEFNLGATSGKLSWLVGAYFVREKNDFLWDVDFLGGLGLGLIPLQFLPPSAQSLKATYTLFDQTKTSWSLFTQESYKLDDKTTVTAGARWTSETKDFHAVGYYKTAYDAHGIPPGTPIPGYDVHAKKTWSAPQWRLGIDHKLSSDALVFATAARGFRSGGYNGGARTLAEASGTPFDPEYATTYELGTKTEWMNRKLRLNATLFKTHYKDQQVAFLNTGGVFGTSTINSDMSGVELEAVFKPTKGLQFFANLGTIDGSTNSLVTLFAPNPKYQAMLGFSYNQSMLNNMSWFVGANYFRIAEADLSTQHDPFRRAPANGNLGAHVGVSDNDGHWKVELSGTNLQNVYTQGFGFNIPGLQTQTRAPNDPRLYKLKLTYNF